MPTLYSYLVDADSQYILTEDGERIVLEAIDYEITGTDWRRIASCGRIPFVRSFDVRRTDSGAWAVTLNKMKYIGTYPDRNAALLVVLGFFTNAQASDDGAEVSMSWQLTQGASSIDDLQEGDVGYVP